jgi:hypothetical protein
MNTLMGGVAGAVGGGIAAFFLTKVFLKRADVGVTGAAAGAGFLIGAAIMSAPVAAAPVAQLPTPR